MSSSSPSLTQVPVAAKGSRTKRKPSLAAPVSAAKKQKGARKQQQPSKVAISTQPTLSPPLINDLLATTFTSTEADLLLQLIRENPQVMLNLDEKPMERKQLHALEIADLKSRFTQSFIALGNTKKLLHKVLWQLLVFRSMKDASDPYLAGFHENHQKLEEQAVRQNLLLSALVIEMKSIAAVLSERVTC